MSSKNLKKYIDLDPKKDIKNGIFTCKCGKEFSEENIISMLVNHIFYLNDNHLYKNFNNDVTMFCGCGQEYNIISSMFSRLSLSKYKNKYIYTCDNCNKFFKIREIYNLIQSKTWFICPRCTCYILTKRIGIPTNRKVILNTRTKRKK